ncbi:hypothetical protein N8364_03565 [Saprospiraceae bacterium]|nr:hypothetical protein [Saprospiraceae bacterium]
MMKTSLWASKLVFIWLPSKSNNSALKGESLVFIINLGEVGFGYTSTKERLLDNILVLR